MNIPNILALADYIENKSSDFNMLHWDTCIVGQCRKMCEVGYFPGNYSNEAMAFLGIRGDTATRLFIPIGYVTQRGKEGARLAARVLRHLAETGDVKWDLPAEEVQSTNNDVATVNDVLHSYQQIVQHYQRRWQQEQQEFHAQATETTVVYTMT